MDIYDSEGHVIPVGGGDVVVNEITKIYEVKGVAHRGLSSEAPENTLPAYKAAKEDGFKYAETDVCFTSDNVPVLLHDITINRTARNADGSYISNTIPISSITYQQALTYDFGIWKGNQFAGTKIPTFEQFMKLCRDIALHPYIELKDTATFTLERIRGLVDTVIKMDMLDSVTWISFSKSWLEFVKTVNPYARLGFLDGWPSQTSISNALGLRNGHNEVFLDFDLSRLDTAVINNCIASQLPIEVYTVDNSSTILNANAYISGFTSNSLDAPKVLLDNYLN